MQENSLWIEKYRPKTFADIKGQEHIVERIKAMVKEKNISHMLFAGPPGIGKTSLIYVAAKSLYSDNYQRYVLDLNASHERGIDVIRTKIKDFAKTISFGNMHKIIILDEADALTKDAQHALRRTMEIYSNTTRFCLIANYPSKIIEPIQSRCAVFYFKPLEEKHIEEIIQNIAKNENLKISQEASNILFSLSNGDVRKVQNILQSCASISKNITKEIISQISTIATPTEIKEILNLAINKNFIKARTLLLETMLKQGLSGFDVIKEIQREILNLNVKEETKAAMIEKCGEAEFRLVEGSDEYLQLEALLAGFALIEK